MLVPTSVTYGQPYKTFPKVAEKEGHTFKWFTTEEGGGQGDEITSESIVRIAKDHTLYGLFIPNNYTAKFSFGNGLSATFTVEFGEIIPYPADPEKKGFSFDGWEPSGIINMPARDVSFTAKWSEIVSPHSDSSSSSLTKSPTEYVEIVFGKKEMSEQEIKTIIEKYTGGNEYEMKIVAVGDDDTTTVIIMFKDVDTAKDFVRTVKDPSRSVSHIVRAVGFVTESDFSLTLRTLPATILFYLYFAFLLFLN